MVPEEKAAVQLESTEGKVRASDSELGQKDAPEEATSARSSGQEIAVQDALESIRTYREEGQ
jgi:hypothetical protein